MELKRQVEPKRQLPARGAKKQCLKRLEEHFKQEDMPDFEADGYNWGTLSFLGNGLYLHSSSIEGAGCGVFAGREFSKNDII
jgi:hypothetical protein